MDLKKFGERLRMARKAKGLTANDLAELANIASGDYYTRYERGTRTPSPETVMKLCELLDTTPNFLYADDLGYKDDIDSKFSKLQVHERKAVEALIDGLLIAASDLVAFEVAGREDLPANDDVNITE